MTRCKVLVIDPDVAVQKELEAELREEFDTWGTGDASTAATLCLEWEPDVIVMELGLPPRPTKPDHGVKLLRDIRSTRLCQQNYCIHSPD